METKKISEFEIEITKVEPAKESKTKYERSFIEKQIKDIQKSKDDFDALRDAELEECNQILSSMDDLGITLKPLPIEKLPVEDVKLNETPLEEIIR